MPIAVPVTSAYSYRAIIGAPIAMGIVGNLKTMQLEELLQWLSQSKKAGTLHINNGKVEKRVFFKDGRIISSASTDPQEYLGHFLVSHGLISEVELGKAIELQEQSGMLLGKILVTTGAITEPDLHKFLRLKAEESIYNIFSWAEGEFRFIDDALPESLMVPMNLDVTALILEGVQRVDEWRRIRKLIPTQDAIPVSLGPWDERDLEPGAEQILELVDDERTVEEIRLATHSSEYHVSRVLFDQYQKGRLKVVKPRWRANASAARAGGDGLVDAKALVKAAQGYLAQRDFEHALRHLRAAKSLEPESREVQEAAKDGETLIRQQIEGGGVKLTSVPKLSVSMEEMTASKITPQEGFMLTRINGSYDIQSIIKITPMPQLDALLIFHKLHEAGYIKLEAGKKG